MSGCKEAKQKNKVVSTTAILPGFAQLTFLVVNNFY